MAITIDPEVQGQNDVEAPVQPLDKGYIKRKSARNKRRADRALCRDLMALGIDDEVYDLDDIVIRASVVSVSGHGDNFTVSWT